ncbi:MAG: alpha/beta hydrolase [Austwickia sp.]|nr:alpha/beta hydrolase [Austwickia sp.]MBK8435203.1 alpha/beta hydrolase [Austwickia sp.]MBK9101244.1 alpha/beta hydrolase [Austwickia sp.]
MKRSTEELDRQIREHELTAYHHYELEPVEDTLLVDTTVGERTVRFMEIGADNHDDIPLLVLHGVGSWSVLIVEMLPYLRNRRIILMDWPGHGLSGPCEIPGASWLRDFSVSVIAGILDEIGIPSVDVLGHSLGGMFSLYAANALPDRIRRVALVGAPGAALPGAKPIMPMIVMAMPVVGSRVLSAGVSEETFNRFNVEALGEGAGAHLPPGVVTTGRLMSTRPAYPTSVSSYFRALIRGKDLRSEHALTPAQLGALRQPVLICWGDKDSFGAPMATASSIVALRDHRLLRLPYAGHAPWLDEPELVGHALAEHLRPQSR